MTVMIDDHEGGLWTGNDSKFESFPDPEIPLVVVVMIGAGGLFRGAIRCHARISWSDTELTDWWCAKELAAGGDKHHQSVSSVSDQEILA